MSRLPDPKELALTMLPGGELVWSPRSPSSFRRPEDARRWNSNFAGKPAGSVNSEGYVLIGLTVDGRRRAIKRSHIVWALTRGSWPDAQIDHINGVRADDRPENLRRAEAGENVRNSNFSRGASGVRGVYKSRDGWASSICLDGERHFLGEFVRVDEAASAYERASKLLHAEFSPHMRPGQ